MSDIETQLAAVKAEHDAATRAMIRAEHDRDAATAAAATLCQQLADEFGVTTLDQAKELLEQYQAQLADDITILREQLGSAR
jgi:hypothetical protein